MRILIVEDNIKMAQNLKTYLELEKCKVDTAADGKRGLYMMSVNLYDAVILDINLPEMNGKEVCAELRANNNNTPILMLTSNGSLNDKVSGLNIGADDYLTKPFEFEEVLARLHALARRTSQNKSASIQIHDIEIDFNAQDVTKNGETIVLSPLEMSLLMYLARNQHKVISRRELLEKVWGDFDDHAFSRTVDIYIGYLRKKLGKEIIQTKKGAGYIIP